MKEEKLNLRELESDELRSIIQNLSQEYQGLHNHSIACQNEYHYTIFRIEFYFESYT